jgi:hypothetical protein
MANDEITDIGPNVKVSSRTVPSQPAYGNGSLKAGAIVSINSTTNKVQGIDTNSADDAQLRGVGVLRERYDTAIETAITDGDPCNVDFPGSKDVYRVRFTDPTATYYKNHPVGLSATAGTLAIVTDISDLGNVIGYLNQDIANGDTVAEVRFR